MESTNANIKETLQINVKKMVVHSKLRRSEKKMSEMDLDLEREKEIERLKEIFTLENAIKYYKRFSDENPYKCKWVDDLEGEMIQFAYKSGKEIVIERIHFDDIADAGEWEHIKNHEHGSEMIFSPNDLANLLIQDRIWCRGV